MVNKKLKEAMEYLSKHGDAEAYDFATELLAMLQGRGFCIWQTYTVEDVEANLGHRPSDDEMQLLGDALQCFENIRV